MPVAQTANAPSFESVWAILHETAQMVKEVSASQKETDRQMRKTDHKMDILSEQMGGLNNKFGELAEHLVAPGIIERFNNLGYHFDSIADRGLKILDEKRKIKTEIDILLENGDYILVVEVKADVRKNDIEHHVKRLEIFRDYRKKHNDLRKIRGAIAGAIFVHEMKELALANGFYVLEQSGDTMKMDIPEDFKPKEW